MTDVSKYADECRRCGAFRYLTVSRKSGQYVVDLPSGCHEKDVCELLSLKGRFEPIRMPAPSTNAKVST